jgi:hypothetical protein
MGDLPALIGSVHAAQACAASMSSKTGPSQLYQSCSFQNFSIERYVNDADHVMSTNPLTPKHLIVDHYRPEDQHNGYEDCE